MRHLQHSPVIVMTADNLKSYWKTLRRESPGHGNRGIMQHRDVVARAHPVNIITHLAAVDFRHVWLVDIECRHLRHRQDEVVILLEELATLLVHQSLACLCATNVGDPLHEGVAGEIYINYDRCTNCRICEDHCPVNCITFERVRFVDDTMRIVEKPRVSVELPLVAVH